jgi:hypothetical protein
MRAWLEILRERYPGVSWLPAEPSDQWAVASGAVADLAAVDDDLASAA